MQPISINTFIKCVRNIRVLTLEQRSDAGLVNFMLVFLLRCKCGRCSRSICSRVAFNSNTFTCGLLNRNVFMAGKLESIFQLVNEWFWNGDEKMVICVISNWQFSFLLVKTGKFVLIFKKIQLILMSVKISSR